MTHDYPPGTPVLVAFPGGPARGTVVAVAGPMRRVMFPDPTRCSDWINLGRLTPA